MNRRAISLLVNIVLFLGSCAAVAQTRKVLSGTVVSVYDGDSVTILDATKRQHKIRLSGIDAPERKQDFGQRSKRYLSGLVFGKEVTIEGDKIDRNGRRVGKVLVNGRDANLEMVTAGFAWWYRDYQREQSPRDRELYEVAETRARKEKLGLWLIPNPQPPWEFWNGTKPPSPISPKPDVRLATAPIIGNRNSKIYHLPGCQGYHKVAERNRVPFNTRAAAEAAGYRAARNCR